MRQSKVAAVAQAVLFRRLRTVLVRAHGDGLIATTLHFDYEVRSAKEAFAEIPTLKIEGEMLDIAKHIVKTKKGEFDPKTFDDRYDAALAELVKANITPKKLPRPEPSSNLMEAPRRRGREWSQSEAPRPHTAPLWDPPTVATDLFRYAGGHFFSGLPYDEHDPPDSFVEARTDLTA